MRTPADTLPSTSISGHSRCHVSSSARSDCDITREMQSIHCDFSKEVSEPISASGRERTDKTASDKHCKACCVPLACGGLAFRSPFGARHLERFAWCDTMSKRTSRSGVSLSSTKLPNMASNPESSCLYHPSAWLLFSSQLPHCWTTGCASASCLQSVITRTLFRGSCKKRLICNRTAIRDWTPKDFLRLDTRAANESDFNEDICAGLELEPDPGVVSPSYNLKVGLDAHLNLFLSCVRKAPGSTGRPNSARTPAMESSRLLSPESLAGAASGTKPSLSPPASPLTELLSPDKFSSWCCRRSHSSFSCLPDNSV
mmetsp:Transcript_83885/g.234107  ORF Transcript_83885/g.234107 Transcript_83885/m.234107 type:complete len:314 (-) Transcript_83885:490-1431(-)